MLNNVLKKIGLVKDKPLPIPLSKAKAEKIYQELNKYLNRVSSDNNLGCKFEFYLFERAGVQTLSFKLKTARLVQNEFMTSYSFLLHAPSLYLSLYDGNFVIARLERDCYWPPMLLEKKGSISFVFAKLFAEINSVKFRKNNSEHLDEIIRTYSFIDLVISPKLT